MFSRRFINSVVFVWGLVSTTTVVVGAARHLHDASSSLSSSRGYRLVGRRDLKMGKKGKDKKGSSSSEEAAELTVAPSTSSPAPTYASSKSKKKGKSKKKKGKKGGKGGMKSTKGEDSLEPTASPVPVSSNATSATVTSAPSVMVDATDPPILDTNATDTTIAPSVEGTTKTGKGKRSKKGKKGKKSKKSKKGGKGGKGKSKSGKGKCKSDDDDEDDRTSRAPKAATTVTDAPGPVPGTDVETPPPLDISSPPPMDITTTSPVATTTRTQSKTKKRPTPFLSAAVSAPRVPSPQPNNGQTKRPKKSKTSSKATPSEAPSTFINASPALKPRQPTETASPSVSTFQPTVGSSVIALDNVSVDRVTISPFQITYSIIGETSTYLPTEEQMSEVVEISLTFVHDFFALSFELLNELTQYDSLEGSRTASTDNSVIQYSSSARFSVESSVLPTANDLDTLLTSAFQQPSVETLLIMLRNLPIDNPYSKTTSVVFQTITDQPTNNAATTGTGLGDNAFIGVASALLTACFVTGAAALYRRGICKGTCWRKQYTKAPGTPEKDKSGGLVAVHSTSGSSRGSHSTKVEDNDGSYRSRIIEEDVEEIEFFHSIGQESESSKIDPLFQASPLLSNAKGRKTNGI